MQLDAEFGAPRDHARQRVEGNLDPAVQGQLVHLRARCTSAWRAASSPQVALGQAADHVADGAETRPGTPATRNPGSGSPVAACRPGGGGAALSRCEACWWAAWARGGTSRFFSGHGQAAHDPSRRLVVVERRLQGLANETAGRCRLVSEAVQAGENGALTPAAHTTSSAGSIRCRRWRTPPGRTSATLALDAHRRQGAQQLRPGARQPLGRAAARGCGLDSTDSLMSLSALTWSRPGLTTSRVAWWSSAASSTPVAPYR